MLKEKKNLTIHPYLHQTLCDLLSQPHNNRLQYNIFVLDILLFHIKDILNSPSAQLYILGTPVHGSTENLNKVSSIVISILKLCFHVQIKTNLQS